jgi:NitT/TauT family transport system substrate-binding protein
MRRAIAAALIAVLCCGTAAPAVSEPVKIRIGWVVVPAELTPIMFAHPGIAKHANESYVLELTHFAGSSLDLTAFASNNLDISGIGFGALDSAIEGAKIGDLLVIADGAQDSVEGWHTNPYLVLRDSPIRKVTDLKGKILAANAIGSTSDIGQRAMLRRNGMDDRKDVTTIEVRFPNMKAMLLDGKVDMIAPVPPFDMDPDLRAATRVLFTQRDSLGRTQVSAVVVHGDFVKQHRAAVVDFLEDSMRATRWYLDPANHKEAVQIVADFLKRPPAAFDSWLFTRQDQYRDPGLLLDVEVVKNNLNLARSLGFVKSDIDIERYVDLSLVRDAGARLRP